MTTKSFYSSRAISCKPGFNVVVGQNDVGKSALTEALSLAFAPNPHFSRLTIPSVGVLPTPISRAVATFEVDADEIKEIPTHQLIEPILVPAGPPGHDLNLLARKFSRLIYGGASVEATYEAGGDSGGPQITKDHLRGYEFDPAHGDRGSGKMPTFPRGKSRNGSRSTPGRTSIST